METNNTHPTAFALEKYVLEKTADTAVTTHLTSCITCQEQIKEIQNQQKAFLVTHPFESFYEKTKMDSRLRGNDKGRKSIFDFFTLPSSSLRWVGGLVMAMLALFILKPVLFETSGVRFKGEPVLGFYIKDGEKAVLGKSGEPVAPGNQIRLYVNPGSYTHVVVLGIESDGTINRYYPDKGETSIPIPQNTPYFFPDSVVLDQSPHNEMIVAAFGDADLNYETVEQKIKNINMGDSIKKLTKPNLDKTGLPNAFFFLNKGE